MDYEKFVSERIAKLRINKGVSARDMSLSIGQNVNYINQIENNKTEPSLTGLYYICDYFGITPNEFFDVKNQHPTQIQDIVEDMKLLSKEELYHLSAFLKLSVKKKTKT